MLYSLFAVISTALYAPSSASEEDEALTCIEKTTIILFSIAPTFSLVISILFWVLLFDPSADYLDNEFNYFFTYTTHAGNIFLSLLNLFCSRIKIKPAHALINLLVPILFFPINAGCSFGNNRDVYSVLKVSDASPN